MARIVLHAGMGKTGSSSIQYWLREQKERLHKDVGVTVLRATVEPSGGVRIDRCTEGDVNSGAVMKHYQDHPEDREKVAETLFSEVGRLANLHGVVVLSSEGFAFPISGKDPIFLKGLNELASSHDVHTAYYVRPQHTALEAAWRQWGFRGDQSPSMYLEDRSQQLHYFQTLTFVRDVAPRVRFVVRPFRRDLLDEGDVVVDFGRNFLGVEVEPSEVRVWENRGLPLDLVNTLHAGPLELLWRAPEARYVNPVLAQLRRFMADLDVPESEEARLSRLVLQQTCHERFEDENRRLIATLAWETEEWIPPVDVNIGEVSFRRLDELWRSHASPAELAVLRHALARVVETGASEDSAPKLEDLREKLREQVAETRRLRGELRNMREQVAEARLLRDDLRNLRSRRSVRAALWLARMLRAFARRNE